MRRKKISYVITWSVAVFLFGTTLIGCNGLEDLDKSIVINNNVRDEVTRNNLKVIEKKEYLIEQSYSNIVSLFFRDDGSPYILLREEEDEKLRIEKIIFDGESVKGEFVENIKLNFSSPIRTLDELSYYYQLESDNKLIIYSPYTDKEFLINYDKLKESDFYKESDFLDYLSYLFVDNKLIEIVYSEEKANVYKSIKWYDIENDSTGKIDIPSEISIDHIIGGVDDMLYYSSFSNSENDWSNEIGTIDLQNNTISTPIPIGEILSEKIIDNDRVLVLQNKEETLTLSILNIKNKVLKEIDNVSKNIDLFNSFNNTNKIGYEQYDNDKRQVIIHSIDNEGVSSRCEVYEYDPQKEKIETLISRDGKELLITSHNIVSDGNEDVNGCCDPTRIDKITRVKFNE